VKRFLLIPVFVAFWVMACSAAQKGGILAQPGPCGGDGLETRCSWGGCCPGGTECFTNLDGSVHACESEKPGPKYLGQ